MYLSVRLCFEVDSTPEEQRATDPGVVTVLMPHRGALCSALDEDVAQRA